MQISSPITTQHEINHHQDQPKPQNSKPIQKPSPTTCLKGLPVPGRTKAEPNRGANQPPYLGRGDGETRRSGRRQRRLRSTESPNRERKGEHIARARARQGLRTRGGGWKGWRGFRLPRRATGPWLRRPWRRGALRWWRWKLLEVAAAAREWEEGEQGGDNKRVVVV